MDEHTISAENLEAIRQEARQAGADGMDISARIHAITLRAIEQRSLNAAEIKAMLASVSAGVNLGLAERGGDIAQSLRAAVHGMDQALVKFAQSIQLITEEMLASGREFREGELKQSLQTLRELEHLLIEAIRQTADTSAGTLRAETDRIATHLRATGSDAGGQARDSLIQLVAALRAAAHSGKISAQLGARELASRVALFASGLLTGAGEALRNKAK